MSKKDYQAIARAIHEAKPTGKDADGLHSFNAEYARQDVWFPIVERLADILAADNPRFDRERFVQACETGGCKGMRRSA